MKSLTSACGIADSVSRSWHVLTCGEPALCAGLAHELSVARYVYAYLACPGDRAGDVIVGVPRAGV